MNYVDYPETDQLWSGEKEALQRFLDGLGIEDNSLGEIEEDLAITTWCAASQYYKTEWLASVSLAPR